MESKATNDAVALIRGLAELRGRNAEWAEKAVREAATLNTNQALQEHVIELVAADVDDLLRAVNGRKVVIANKERTLSTLGVEVERIEPDFMTKALGTLANPNVALVLMLIGIYGLIFELMNSSSRPAWLRFTLALHRIQMSPPLKGLLLPSRADIVLKTAFSSASGDTRSPQLIRPPRRRVKPRRAAPQS